MPKTDILSFSFHGANVRVVVIDGEPWMVGRDVAERLGYTNPQKAVRDHCKHGRPAGVNGSFILDPQTTLIPESDMYRLVMRSHMKQAEEFEEWVTGTVLPSIRKTGGYRSEPTFPVPKTFPEALRLAADLAEENERQKATIAVMQPKAVFHDAVAVTDDGQSIREVAKILGTGQNRMFRWLREQGILMADNQPYQQFMDQGYFRVIEQTYDTPDGATHPASKTLVTGKGLIWLHKRWADASSKRMEPTG